MGILCVNNLLVRSHVGFDPHLEKCSQDLLVCLKINYSSYIEEESDNPEDAFDIKQLTDEIVGRAKNSHFNLIEAFTRMLLNTVLEFKRVDSAEVEVKRVKTIEYSGELVFSLSGSNR